MATKQATQKGPNVNGANHGPTPATSREQLVRLLNEDLAREYQAIIAYVVYSQVLKGPST